MSFYSVLKTDLECLIVELGRLDPNGHDFYEVRDLFTSKRLDPTVNAAAFLYLMSFCFNGVYRTNRLGQYNVPRGSRCPGLPSNDRLRDASERLQRCVLDGGDFQRCVSKAQPGDLVYMDPPYEAVRPTYGEYGYEWDPKSLPARVAAVATDLSNRGVKVMISYGSDALAPMLPNSFEIRPIREVTLIAGSHSRRSRKDHVYRNYDA